MSGKMMRACDCCLRKRARWYCLADDAFLCLSCDGSVHSANPFASRHDRVRLKTISFNPNRPHLPSWHRGSTCKARTPRHGKSGQHRSKSEDSIEPNTNRLYAVPELGIDETTSSSLEDETEDKLLHRVPTFDSYVAEISSSQDEFEPSELYFEEFAADVETLLGNRLDEQSFGIEELGLLNCNNNNNDNDVNTPIDFFKPVKAEENELVKMIGLEGDDVEIREPFDFSFDSYDDDHIMIGENLEDKKVGLFKAMMESGKGDDNELLLCKLEEKDVEIKRSKILLRLDYEAISEAWASQGSPWMNGHRPEIHPDDCWPHFMGTCRAQTMVNPLNIDQVMGGHEVNNDGGREARVSRYREKRRTRLFSKKIRYEVRKLNAEKRPRMKGRFVKRSSFTQTASPVFPLSKSC